MKKIFVVFISLMFIMCLGGCDESQEMVNINFIINGESHLVQIEKGCVISKEMIPLINDKEEVELYYDENMKNEYDGNVLNKDSKMYVKTDIKICEDITKKIKSKYVSDYLLKYNENASIDEVYINEFYGVYNNAYVLIMSNDYVEYFAAITEEVILNYRFIYPNNNVIKVFYDGSFYTLTSAYLNNILSRDDIAHIYEKFVK